MSFSDERSLSCEIVDEHSEFRLADLCRMFALDEREIREWVEEGVLSVIEIESTEWRFSGASLRRARIAVRLQRDLGINLPGVALALDLLEELEQLRRERKVERS